MHETFKEQPWGKTKYKNIKIIQCGGKVTFGARLSFDGGCLGKHKNNSVRRQGDLWGTIVVRRRVFAEKIQEVTRVV